MSFLTLNTSCGVQSSWIQFTVGNSHNSSTLVAALQEKSLLALHTSSQIGVLKAVADGLLLVLVAEIIFEVVTSVALRAFVEREKSGTVGDLSVDAEGRSSDVIAYSLSWNFIKFVHSRLSQILSFGLNIILEVNLVKVREEDSRVGALRALHRWKGLAIRVGGVGQASVAFEVNWSISFTN